ncbi:MAG: hypothetical protein R3C11_22630 [Planctomycetaceae bacterium]
MRWIGPLLLLIGVFTEQIASLSAAPPALAERLQFGFGDLIILLDKIDNVSDPNWELWLEKLDQHHTGLSGDVFLQYSEERTSPEKTGPNSGAQTEMGATGEIDLTVDQLISQLRWRLDFVVTPTFSVVCIRLASYATTLTRPYRFRNDPALIAELQRMEQEYEPPSEEELFQTTDEILNLVEDELFTEEELRKFNRDIRKHQKWRLKYHIKTGLNPRQIYIDYPQK